MCWLAPRARGKEQKNSKKGDFVSGCDKMR